MSFLELARRLRDPEHADIGAPTDLDTAPVLATREQLGAVLIRSPRFGEVWLVLEPSMLTEFVAEESSRGDLRPALLAEHVAKLRGKSDEMIRAALRTFATFPSARLTQ